MGSEALVSLNLLTLLDPSLAAWGAIPVANLRLRLPRPLLQPGVVPTTTELASWLAADGVASVVVEDLAQPTFESRVALGRLEAV